MNATPDTLQLLTHTRTGAHGWSFDGNAQVYSGGQWRLQNGLWAVQDEVDAMDLDALSAHVGEDAALAAVAYLDEQAAAAQARAERLAGVQAQAALQASLPAVRAACAAQVGRPVRVQCLDGVTRSFAAGQFGQLYTTFCKRGGYVRWSLPVSDTQAQQLLAGTHEVRYTVGGNTASVVAKVK